MAVLVYFEKFSLKNSNSFFRFFLKVINNKIKNNHQLLLNRDKTLKKNEKNTSLRIFTRIGFTSFSFDFKGKRQIQNDHNI